MVGAQDAVVVGGGLPGRRDCWSRGTPIPLRYEAGDVDVGTAGAMVGVHMAIGAIRGHRSVTQSCPSGPHAMSRGVSSPVTTVSTSALPVSQAASSRQNIPCRRRSWRRGPENGSEDGVQGQDRAVKSADTAAGARHGSLRSGVEALMPKHSEAS